MDQDVGILISAKDMGATSTLRKVQGGIAGVQGQAAGLSAGVQSGMGGAIAGVNRRLGGFKKNAADAFGHARQGAIHAAGAIKRVGVIAGGLALAGGVAAVKWAGEFEEQLQVINTIAKETPAGLQAIGDRLRKVSRDTGQDLSTLTAGYYDLLSAGVEAGDAQAVLDSAVTLGIGGLASTAETIDLLTTAYNVYGGGAQGAITMADQFAKTIEKGKIKATDLAANYATVADSAKVLGLENKEITTSFALLTAAGRQPGVVATQMQAAIVSLQKPTDKLRTLAKETGHNYLRIAENKGLVVALERLRKDAEKANVPLIELFGRKEGWLYTLGTTGDQFRPFMDLLAEMDPDKVGGQAGSMAAERMKGFSFQMDRVRASIKDAGITIGTELLPPIADAAAEFSDWLGKPEQQQALKQLAKDIGVGFKEAVTAIRGFDFSGIRSALEIGAGFAKTLIDAFLNAPGWLKTAVITGWGLNKITGGALTGIAGSLTKGVIGGGAGVLSRGMFGGRGNSPANPLYVVASGGLGGAGGAGGVAGKGMGMMAKGVMAVSIVGMAASVIAAWGAFSAQNEAEREKVRTQGEQFRSTASEQEMLAAWHNLKTVTDEMSGVGKAIFGLSDLTQGIPILEDLTGKVAETNETEIAALESALGRTPTMEEAAAAAAAVAAKVVPEPEPEPAAPPPPPPGAVTAGTPVKMGRAAATELAAALNTHLVAQTASLTTILQTIAGGGTVISVKEGTTQIAQGIQMLGAGQSLAGLVAAVNAQTAVAQAQLATLAAILGRSRDIHVTVNPAPITLYVDGYAVANALSDHIYKTQPAYPDGGGLP